MTLDEIKAMARRQIESGPGVRAFEPRRKEATGPAMVPVGPRHLLDRILALHSNAIDADDDKVRLEAIREAQVVALRMRDLL
jgi:hypothetical protein